MLRITAISLSLVFSLANAYGKVVVFWEPGFPVIDANVNQVNRYACLVAGIGGSSYQGPQRWQDAVN